MQTIEEIGPSRFSGASADNTGNTRSGRFKTSTRWSWILNLQDPCHKLSLAIKGICKLDEFIEVSEDRDLIFHASSLPCATRSPRSFVVF